MYTQLFMPAVVDWRTRLCFFYIQTKCRKGSNVSTRRSECQNVLLESTLHEKRRKSWRVQRYIPNLGGKRDWQIYYWICRSTNWRGAPKCDTPENQAINNSWCKQPPQYINYVECDSLKVGNELYSQTIDQRSSWINTTWKQMRTSDHFKQAVPTVSHSG